MGPTLLHYYTTLLLRSFTVKGTLKEVAGGNMGLKELCLFLCFHSKKKEILCHPHAVLGLFLCWGHIVIRQERMGSNAPGGGCRLSSGDRREDRTHGSARREQGETWERHVLT